MANMTVTQRTQFERVDLSVPSHGHPSPRPPAGDRLHRRSRPPCSARSATRTVVAIDGWAQAVVLGVIMLTTVGAMIAVNPLRRG